MGSVYPSQNEMRITVRITNRNNYTKSPNKIKKVNTKNLKKIKVSPLTTEVRATNHVFGPSVLLANTMSLLPKIDEDRSVVQEENPDFACLTETWLQDSTIN